MIPIQVFSCKIPHFEVSLPFVSPIELCMYIVAIGWIYVVLMMSIAEKTATAGVMTFLLYGVSPVTIILYLLGTPERRRRRAAAKKLPSVASIEATLASSQDEAEGHLLPAGNTDQGLPASEAERV
jgi:hypothetical protein